MGKKKKKQKEDKTLKQIGYGLGAAGALLLGWYGVNRYKIWLDNKKAEESTTTTVGGGGSSGTTVIPPSANVICKGDKKTEVRILQNYLKYVKGLYIGSVGVDGDWGTNTQLAVDKLYTKKTCFTKGEIDMMADAYILGGF